MARGLARWNVRDAARPAVAVAAAGVAGADDGDGKCGGRSFGFERGEATEDGRNG